MDDKKPPRVTLTNQTTGKKIEFITNPHELEEAKSVIWEEPAVAGAEGPPMKFKHGGPRTFRLTATFIAKGDADDIIAQLDDIRDLSKPQGGLKEPPKVLVTVGETMNEICRLKNYSIKHQAFTTALKPSRGDVTLDFSLVYNTGADATKNGTKPGQTSDDEVYEMILKDGENKTPTTPSTPSGPSDGSF